MPRELTTKLWTTRFPCSTFSEHAMILLVPLHVSSTF
uniref:Uncharacterized protein n=1 Tax=Rhizophora mucronata TaxID=61149 RepID=A0A2P2QHQ6_RHIMU